MQPYGEIEADPHARAVLASSLAEAGVLGACVHAQLNIAAGHLFIFGATASVTGSDLDFETSVGVDPSAALSWIVDQVMDRLDGGLGEVFVLASPRISPSVGRAAGCLELALPDTSDRALLLEPPASKENLAKLFRAGAAGSGFVGIVAMVDDELRAQLRRGEVDRDVLHMVCSLATAVIVSAFGGEGWLLWIPSGATQNETEDFVEIDVTVEARDFLVECLQTAGAIGVCLKKAFDLEDGKTSTFVPRRHAAGYGRRVRWGFWMPWQEPLAWAARWIVERVVEKPGCCLLVAHVGRRGLEGLPDGAQSIHLCGDAVQHVLIRGPAASEDVLRTLLGSSGTPRGVACVLSDFEAADDRPGNGVEAPPEWAESLCAGAFAAVFDAFDGEGYLAWLRGP